jgi:peptidoglycan/xylan/chitin deacetylase (PgdA/CDA1 family)
MSDQRRLTFSFDNGPVPRATDTVLDFLAARAIKATFFVVGERLRTEEGRRLAARAHAEGHWIGNHTLTHGEPLGIGGSRERVAREIGETQQLLGGLAHPRKFFRPNGRGSLGPHLLSRAALDYLVEQRFTLVTWNNVPRDWEEPKTAWVGKALATVSETPWSLLVLHDEHVAGMMPTLVEFCRRLTDLGVEIVQDFPASCVPIRQGEIVAPVDDLLASDRRDAPAMAGAQNV